uniref:Methyltransferase type 12 n=1 Tax=Caulobacter sp. (strain K31) TaxID=366602 RepID=B0SVG4_CAUSK
MTITRVAGTQGYDEDVAAFFERSEAVAFADKHAAVLSVHPAAPARILDIGAGSGRDAADFANLGHTVLAVEPTPELLAGAIARHDHPAITWLDDSLPELSAVLTRGERFDLVLLSAVWMHLDEDERRRAMPNLAALLADGGVLILSLRHGPVPPGRRMFAVSAVETIALARAEDLRLVIHETRDSIQAANRLAGVTWTVLAFTRDTSVPGAQQP